MHRERERDRILREEQDRAFQESALRDRERIKERMQEEHRERERKRLEEEEEERKREQEEERKRKEERRVEWRRWMRRMQPQPENAPSKGVRIAVRLPSGGRAIRAFKGENTLTTLYAFVAAQLVPEQFEKVGDPISPPGGESGGTLETHVDAQVERDSQGVEWWGFQLALAFPRKEILWEKGIKLSEVESLKGGGQVVVEMIGNGQLNRNGDDGGYNTEESE